MCQSQRPKPPCKPYRQWICLRPRASRHIPFAGQLRSPHIWRTGPPRLFPHAPTEPRQLGGELTESAGASLRFRRLASLRFPSQSDILLRRIESFKFDLTCTCRAGAASGRLYPFPITPEHLFSASPRNPQRHPLHRCEHRENDQEGDYCQENRPPASSAIWRLSKVQKSAGILLCHRCITPLLRRFLCTSFVVKDRSRTHQIFASQKDAFVRIKLPKQYLSR